MKPVVDTIFGPVNFKQIKVITCFLLLTFCISFYGMYVDFSDRDSVELKGVIVDSCPDEFGHIVCFIYNKEYNKRFCKTLYYSDFKSFKNKDFYFFVSKSSLNIETKKFLSLDGALWFIPFVFSFIFLLYICLFIIL